MSLDYEDDPPRAAAVWDLVRRDEPDARAMQAAYFRFAGRRPGHVSAFILVRWLLAGFVLGWGVAFAATGDPLFGAGLRRTAQTPLPVPSALREAPRRHRASERSPAQPSAVPPLDSAAPEPSPSTAHAPSSPSAPALAETPLADPKWQRAAAALKVHDYAAAETALRDVETAGTPADRDAATLALAQVLLTRGRVVEARARLERLSGHAGAPLVREKAAALLSDLFAAEGRSSGTPAVPQ